MLSVLFTLAYWLVMAWAAAGAVVLLRVLWICLEDWLEDHQRLSAIEADGRWNRLAIGRRCCSIRTIRLSNWALCHARLIRDGWSDDLAIPHRRQ